MLRVKIDVCIILVILIGCAQVTPQNTDIKWKQDNPHPLDPLSSHEIEDAVQIIKSSKQSNPDADDYIYNYIVLQEPPKSALLPFFLSGEIPPPKTIPRKAFLVLSRKNGDVYEALVNLETRELESFERIHSVQAPLTPDDLLTRDIDYILADPAVQKRCARIGFLNMSLVTGGPWNVGYDYGDKFQGKKPNAYFLLGKNFPLDNQYAHPLDFVVIFDTNSRSVLEIQDLPISGSRGDKGNTIPRKESNYLRHLSKGGVRKDSKPIRCDSPEGVSFTINGTEVHWQKWKMRLGYNGREGLVIYEVSYDDDGKRRSILYRASLVEMFVPYGDPRPPFHMKAAFDLGEFGFGYNLDEQSLNEDVIGAPKLLDVLLHDAQGAPVLHKNVISVREEDAGILWKHLDYRTGYGAIARSHRLVLSTIGTFGNYEYILNWMFYQDGSIQFQAQLTGLLSTNLVQEPTRFGSVVSPQVGGQYHQHFFSVRLDFEVDGSRNSVSTLDVVGLEDETGSDRNPLGVGFTLNQTVLKTAAQARSKFSPMTSRVWLVTNPNKVNEVTGTQPGWKLIGQNSPGLLMKENSPIRRRAAFLDYDVWVTPYKDGELYPGGFYLNGSGLPEWLKNDPDAGIENQDVVLWHNFGLVHIPRAEDFPVMSVENVGFWLKPTNFFSENPAMDVP